MSLDRNAKDLHRLLRNQQRERAGVGTSDIKVTAPLANSGTITLTLGATGGLATAANALGIKLDTNPGLTLGAGGLKLTNPTTKGDLLGFDTAPNRVPVGTDGQLLSADSTQTLGVKWKTVGTFTAKAINIEIDFGATPTYNAVFTVTDANATTANGILVNQSGAAPTGKSQDENEMDALDLSAVCTVNGQFTLYVTAFPGPVYGKFKINYMLI